MKHWFNHFRLKKKLYSSRKPLNPKFVEKTRTKLFEHAQRQMGNESVSILDFNWNQMKRYSFAYLSFLLLIGISFYNFFPNKDISAQELITNASTNYETSSETIYYEKRQITDFISKTDSDITIEEVWSNDIGDLLQVVSRNGEQTGSMIKINEFGVPINYESPSIVEIHDEELAMSEAIKRGAIYCAYITISGEYREEALLQVAKTNPAYWFISAGNGDKDVSGYGFVETEGGSNIKDLLSSILKEMNQDNDLSKTNRYTLEERDEEGIKKYVLSQFWWSEEGRHQRTDYIFHGENFILERQEYYDENILSSETIYLDHAFFPASDREAIFNPNSKGLTENPHFTTLIPGYIKESGCYDNGNKLSEEEVEDFLASLPEEASKGYEETVQSIETHTSYPDAENELLIPEESEIEELLNPSVDFVPPSSSHTVTQYFGGLHKGIDIAQDENEDPLPEIFAIQSGTVLSLGTGWNGGYGNAVVIDHDNGYISIYAHLNEILVKSGEEVQQGQIIGLMGNSGRTFGSTGILLHFELSYYGIEVNPLDYFEIY